MPTGAVRARPTPSCTLTVVGGVTVAMVFTVRSPRPMPRARATARMRSTAMHSTVDTTQ